MSMSAVYSILYTGLLLGYWLLILSVSIRVLIQRKPTSYVIAWLFIIYVLPIIGVILYFLLGENHLGSKRGERAKAIWPSLARAAYQIKHNPYIFAQSVSDVATPLFAFCEHKQRIKGIKGNRLTLIDNSNDTMDAMIKDILNAKKSIDMVFYIWHCAGKAKEVTEALMEASQRGVRCRVIVDSAGSRQFFRTKYPHLMREAGIEIVEALKVNIFRFFFRRMDLRQHRKMVLIDNHIAYTGSMNMVDPRFFKQEAGVGEWIDLMVRINGPITSVMQIIYTFDWEVETGTRILPPAPSAPTLPHDEGHIAQIIASGPGFDPNLIHQSLMTAIYSARSSLIMTTPYFVPSDDLLEAICIAAQRGVDVRIILPNKNDSIMVKWASRTFFNDLLSAGVKIYEFQHGLLHTKSVLIDDQLSLIGTVNLDMRSLWLNFEITTVIDDSEFGEHLRELQQNYMQKSTRLRLSNWKKRPLWQRIIERLFYFFAPLL